MMIGRVAYWPGMRRAASICGVLTLIGLGLSACGGLFKGEQRAPWRGQAEAACLRSGEVQPSAHLVRIAPIERGVCGMDSPFRVTAFAQGEVELTSRATLACPMVSRTDLWLATVVQPAAELFYGTRVAKMRVGSYACRTMNNRPGARLSEHSYGNAIDVFSFEMENGRNVTVIKGWKGTPDDQNFLREVFVGACRHFGTVLGPGADMFHYDHFHMDLARHTPDGSRRICKPAIKYDPRIDPSKPMTPFRRQPVPYKAPGQLPGSDDIQDDPFVVSDEIDGPRPAASPRTNVASRGMARDDIEEIEIDEAPLPPPVAARPVALPRQMARPAAPDTYRDEPYPPMRRVTPMPPAPAPALAMPAQRSPAVQRPVAASADPYRRPPPLPPAAIPGVQTLGAPPRPLGVLRGSIAEMIEEDEAPRPPRGISSGSGLY